MCSASIRVGADNVKIMINEFLFFGGELVRLLKSRELEKASLLAATALRTARLTNLRSRQDNVHEITLNIAELRQQHDHLKKAISALPEAERCLAWVNIEEIYRQLFDGEIAVLQTRKRQLSRPAR